MSERRMDIRELRRTLRAAMPAKAFEPQPWRGLIAWIELILFGLGCTVVVLGHLPWWGNLLVSLVLGQLMTSASLVGHEAFHGSVFRSSRANFLLGTAGFLPLLVTPNLWVAWHNQGHHGAPNVALRDDPDGRHDIGTYRRRWIVRMRTRMLPDQRHWLSRAALFVNFTLQGQLFLWAFCDQPGIRDRVRLNLLRERILSVLLIGSWLAGAVALGRNGFWVLVLPLLTCNFTLMCYISSQHWIRPLVKSDDPVLTTISVRAPRLLDWLHFQFSYHQEHHLFPRMSHKFGPLLREKLSQHQPDAVALLPWKTALGAVFATPAIYQDSATLAHEDGTDAVDLMTLAQHLHLPVPGEQERHSLEPTCSS